MFFEQRSRSPKLLKLQKELLEFGHALVSSRSELMIQDHRQAVVTEHRIERGGFLYQLPKLGLQRGIVCLGEHSQAEVAVTQATCEFASPPSQVRTLLDDAVERALRVLDDSFPPLLRLLNLSKSCFPLVLS